MLIFATLLPSNQATDEGVNLEQRLIQMQMDFQRKIEAEYQVVFIADCFVTLMSSVADPGFSKWGGRCFVTNGGHTSCFQVKSA